MGRQYHVNCNVHTTYLCVRRLSWWIRLGCIGLNYFIYSRTLYIMFLFNWGHYDENEAGFWFFNRFEEGADQFRLDVAQNPNDTEESIWCFLCESQLFGVDGARKRFLEASFFSLAYQKKKQPITDFHTIRENEQLSYLPGQCAMAEPHSEMKVGFVLDGRHNRFKQLVLADCRLVEIPGPSWEKLITCLKTAAIQKRQVLISFNF